MEIKATLNKPFTDKQRNDFIAYYCQNCEGVFDEHYELRETETALEAWGYTEEEKREQEEQAEKERILNLFMTRSDFFDGFIMAFGLGQAELRAIVENILNSINITDVEIKVALNNYDNALNFYRKHTLFTLLNNVEIPITEEMTLVFTSDIWDKFFDTKDYHELQKAIKVKPEPEPEPEPEDEEPTEEIDEN